MLRTIRNILSRASIWPRKQPEPVVDDRDKQIQELQRQNRELTLQLTTTSETLDRVSTELTTLANNYQVLVQKKPDVVFSFSQESFNTFQKQFEQGIVTNSTTAHGTGYLLGIQRVLSVLRDNHVGR